MDRIRAALVAAMVVMVASLAACGSSDSGRTASSADSVADSSAGTTSGSAADDVPETTSDERTTADDATTPVVAPTQGPAQAPSSTTGSGSSGAAAASGGVSVAGGGGSSGSGSGGIAVDSAADRCSSGVLAASLVFGDGAGSAGSTTGTLVLRNNSSSACTLGGYPGVSFVGDHGDQLGIPAGRDTSAGATTQTLEPGGSVGAQLSIVDPGVYDAADCRATAATGLRVYPPGNVGALFVKYAVQACQGDERGATVGPVTAR